MHVLGCRIHEYHLGFGLALVAATIGALGKDRAALILFLAAGWLVLKDWRDLFPRLRDTASWRLWIHRVPAPLRERRRFERLPALTAAVALAVGAVNLASALTHRERPSPRLRGRARRRRGASTGRALPLDRAGRRRLHS